MNKFTAAIAVAVVALSGTAAFAEQKLPMDAMESLSSASSISIRTLSPSNVIRAQAGAGSFELVDIASLQARLANNPSFAAQLQSYGTTIDNVVGISGTSESDVTIYVRS